MSSATLDMTSPQDLPVVVIGAGPVGLAAAAHLHEREVPFLVLEACSTVAASVGAWAHVSLFSPRRYAIDTARRTRLRRARCPRHRHHRAATTTASATEAVRTAAAQIGLDPQLALQIAAFDEAPGPLPSVAGLISLTPSAAGRCC